MPNLLPPTGQRDYAQVMADLDAAYAQAPDAATKQALLAFITRGVVPPRGSAYTIILGKLANSAWANDPGRLGQVVQGLTTATQATNQRGATVAGQATLPQPAATPTSVGPQPAASTAPKPSPGQYAMSLVPSLDPGQGGGSGSAPTWSSPTLPTAPGVPPTPLSGNVGAGGGARDSRVTPQQVGGSDPTQRPSAFSYTPPKSETPTMATPTTNTTTPGAGGYLPAQADILANPQDANEKNTRLMVLLRSMGLDPTRLSAVGKHIVGLISPELDTMASLIPFQNGGDGMTKDSLAIAPALTDWAKSFVQSGANPFQKLRDLANGATGNSSFQSMLAGLSDPQQSFQLLDNVLGARNYGLNPLVQQSLSDQSSRQQGNYGLADFDQTGSGKQLGTFYDWLQQQPQQVRSLYGLS